MMFILRGFSELSGNFVLPYFCHGNSKYSHSEMVMKLKTQIFPLSHFIFNETSLKFWIRSIAWFGIEVETETKNCMQNF